MGTIDGGYQVLVDALAAAIRAGGGDGPHRDRRCAAIAAASGRAVGVVTDARPPRRTTTSSRRCIPPQRRAAARARAAADAVGPDRCRYLGVVCLVMRLRRSISPYYALNITDRRVPLTTRRRDHARRRPRARSAAR